MSVLNDLDALRIQVEWGADEGMLDLPVDRFARVRSVQADRPRGLPAQPGPSMPSGLGRERGRAGGGAAAVLAERAAAGAADLGALYAAMDAFDACPLRHTASNTVVPSGDPGAGLIFIGEAPGPDDDRAGQAFSGPVGEMMDRVLASAGLSRDAVLLALMVPWRPPGGRPASEAELGMCLPFLHRLLVLARPRRLVLMGAGPHRRFAPPGNTLRKDRGKWASIAAPGLAPLPTLTMLAPDGWLSTPMSKQATWTDLLNLREHLNDDV